LALRHLPVKKAGSNPFSMKFSVADLLDQLSTDQSVSPATLAKILKLSNKADKAGLDLATEALAKVGALQILDNGDVQGLQNEDLIDARLRCSSKGFCFAIRDDGGDDIYIRDHQLNHAWNGDRVLVRVTREGGRRRSPEGGVQCILERATRSLLAQVKRQDEQLMASPLDDRMLATIQLSEEAEEHLPSDPPTAVVEVVIDRYPLAQYPALGRVARPLPLDGGPAADRELLLTKVGLHAAAPAPRGTAKSPQSKGRTDLTEQPVLLLNGWGIKDAPPLPAVHVEARDGGTRLWVHAPTVSERIGQGNSLDLWLRDRSEALCLGGAWHALLTPALSKACRFKVGESIDALTVRLDVSAKGELTDWEFMLSTIRPVAEIQRSHLAALADRKPRARTVPAALKPLKDHLNQLESVLFCADCLMEQERADGAVILDLPAPAMEALGDLKTLDPTGLRHRWVDALDKRDPNSVLQPLLRAADRAWGEHRSSLGLPAVTVQSRQPDGSVLTDVAKTAIALDLPLELEEDGSPSAQELITVFAGSDQRRVLEQQLSHALPQPMFASGVGLSEEQPTSETAQPDGSTPTEPAPWCCAALSYAHLINQQILQMLLQDAKDRPSVRQKKRIALGRRGAADEIQWPLFTAAQDEKLQGLVSSRLLHRLNARRRQVLELEGDLLALVQARSAQHLVGQEADGRVSGVQSYGFFVEVGETRFEGLVHVSTLNDDWYEYRSRQNRLVGRKNRRVYQLGDPVRVKVMKVDVLRNQIDLEVIPPELEETAAAPQTTPESETLVELTPITLSNP